MKTCFDKFPYVDERVPTSYLNFGTIDPETIGTSTIRLPASCYDVKVCEQQQQTKEAKTHGGKLLFSGSEFYERQDALYFDDEEDEDPKYRSPSDLEIAEWPDKDRWVASWKVVEAAVTPSDWTSPPLTWINVYAYYNRTKGHGGYGVILRNALAKPITASAKFSEDGKSFHYQLYMGIKAGVMLAEKHKRSDLNVLCNSINVTAFFNNVRSCLDCPNKGCSDIHGLNKFCNPCKNSLSWHRGCDMRLVLPLVLELARKSMIVDCLSSLATNEAAHYLAITERKIGISRSRVEKGKNKTCSRVATSDDEPGEIALDDFPQDLKNIIWRDAFVSSFFTYASDCPR